MLLGGSSKKNISIAPTLSQYGLNLREFTSFFDYSSFYIKNNIEIGCTFNVIKGKINDFVLYEPSSSFFIKNFILFTEMLELNREDLLKLIYEISQLKSSRVHSKHLNLRTICKIHVSILKSYSSGSNNKLRELVLC